MRGCGPSQDDVYYPSSNQLGTALTLCPITLSALQTKCRGPRELSFLLQITQSLSFFWCFLFFTNVRRHLWLGGISRNSFNCLLLIVIHWLSRNWTHPYNVSLQPSNRRFANSWTKILPQKPDTEKSLLSILWYICSILISQADVN